MTTQSEAKRMMLRGLIESARSRGMWLWCSYQDLWFSPDELEAKNSQGKFLWGPINWILRDPRDHIQQLEQKIERAEDDLTTLRGRVASSVIAPAPEAKD